MSKIRLTKKFLSGCLEIRVLDSGGEEPGSAGRVNILLDTDHSSASSLDYPGDHSTVQVWSIIATHHNNTAQTSPDLDDSLCPGAESQWFKSAGIHQSKTRHLGEDVQESNKLDPQEYSKKTDGSIQYQQCLICYIAFVIWNIIITYHVRTECEHCLVFARSQPTIQHVGRVGSAHCHSPAPSSRLLVTTWTTSCHLQSGRVRSSCHSISFSVQWFLYLLARVGGLQEVAVGNLLLKRQYYQFL